MNRIMYKVLALVIIGLMMSCAKDKKEPTKNIEDTPVTEEGSVKEDKDLDLTSSKSEVVFGDEKITKLYNQYLLVKKQLVNSKSKLVQKEAKKLGELIDDSDENKQLKATAKLISLTKEIKKQRDFFVTLTEETEKIIGGATITSGKVYKQFCPMAFGGNGGYWLSNSDEVRNPYYGNEMLICGKVDTTIQ
ncbi:DUF3347 domain-containing protein [uncultured Aquimarina sp.]|uniref:DUF3347 domain-containing protein n=1 Tax=uncultured Aquimarina sp. TaxID=575652 RepID=UPI00261E77EC|nr:DUF3347 domain-containing protein [uncultured Aquimarina sp.]